MSPAHLILCVLSCIAFSGVANAVYEDCWKPPPVDNANADLIVSESDHVNTAIYSCVSGYVLKGPEELFCDVDTEEWEGEPPICLKAKDAHSERKQKLPAIDEDSNVPAELVQQLDLSCLEANVEAPEISNGIVAKYERGSHGEKFFLVAYYACNEDYEFENRQINALYCGAKHWVGDLPACRPDDGDDEYLDDSLDKLKTLIKRLEALTSVENEVQTPIENEVHTAVEPQVEQVEETAAHPEVELKPENEQNVEPTTIQNEREIVSENVTDINIVVAPTNDPYSPRLLDENCGEDRGGCAQKCERVLFPGENEPRLKCRCYEGFTLDPQDYSTCHDIDECQESNGGCSHICNNLPGGYECGCEKGYEIDAATRNTCVDIDECALPEVIAECANGCENTPGSYRCVIALNTKEEAEEEEKEEDEEAVKQTKEEKQDNEIEVGPEESVKAVETEPQPELEVEPEAEPICSPGFGLSPDGSVCQDINECDIVVEDDSNIEHVPYRVCQQLCENTLGSFRCSCRDGFHLLEDQVNCQDIDECAQGTHKCSHDCFNTAGGYQCLCPRGMSLQEPEGLACVAPDPCAVNNNGCEQLCRSAENGICACSKGYVLSEDGKSCNDVDECKVNNGGCQQLCHNVPGAYECHCSTGYEMLQLPGLSSDYCFDIDECAQNTHSCEPPLQCENLNGSYTCLCEPGYAWGYDNRIHESSSVTSTSSAASSPSACLDIDECSLANCECELVAFLHQFAGSFQCACPFGFTLNPDDRSCSDHDCAQLCLNQPGGFALIL